MDLYSLCDEKGGEEFKKMMTQDMSKNENFTNTVKSKNKTFEKNKPSPDQQSQKYNNIPKIIIDKVDDISIIAATDKNGIINYVNQKFCDISKYSREELIGQNHRILKSGHHPDEFYKKMWGIISSGNTWKGYVKNKAKDGSLYWVKTTISPFFNDQKELQGYISFRIDVTEKFNVQEKLAKAKQKFQNLYDKSPAMLATINYDGFILEQNDSFSKKFNSTLKTSKIFLLDLISDNQTGYYKKLFTTWKNKKEGIEFDVVLIDKNNDKFPAKIKIKRTTNDKNSLGHMAIIDQSEKKHTDAVINTLKTEKMAILGELSAHFSHDIRNPLSIISNSLEILELKYRDYILPDTKIETDRMQRAVRRITHQVEDVLDYVRISKYDKEIISFLVIIRDVIDKIKIPENIDIQLVNSNVDIFCDYVKICAVCSNLLLNSIQSIGDKSGKILIKCVVNGVATITFQDSGIGIDEKNTDKIFEPLFTTKQHGTGLGLASCKNIIEGHDGNITFKNNPTRFFVTLPYL